MLQMLNRDQRSRGPVGLLNTVAQLGTHWAASGVCWPVPYLAKGGESLIPVGPIMKIWLRASYPEIGVSLQCLWLPLP